MEDVFKTLAKPTDVVLLKDRKSKFFGYAFSITTEEEVKPLLDELWKRYHTACHVCYAWQLGVGATLRYRANDDGEPNNSAGMPFYGQIKTVDITNVLVAVPRIYGGTKLGVGGLIQAYKGAAQLALEQADIVEKTVSVQFKIGFTYADMTKVMRLVNQHGFVIVNQEMTDTCVYTLEIRKSKSEQVIALFKETYGVRLLP